MSSSDSLPSLPHQSVRDFHVGSTIRSFHLRSANIFLTYPHCSVSPQEAGEFLWGKARPYNPIYIIISSEFHQDNTPHLHCLLQTDKPVKTRDPSFFDIQGHHPNIQPSRSPNKTREYILKNPISKYERGVFIPRGGFIHGASAGNSTKQTKNEIMADIISSSTSKQDYLSMVQKAFPFDWATKLQHFEYSAERLFPTTEAPFIPPHPVTTPDLHCYETIETWMTENIYQGDAAERPSRPRSLYIVGPTRTGKTTWARSIAPSHHNYWQNCVDFTCYNKDAKYNVIDDIPFKFCPCWKQLVGGQRDFTVNPKYGKKKRIPGGIPSIILVNNDEDWMKCMTPAQLEYFECNCDIYVMESGERFFS
nr:replication-associated protein [Eleusine indica associated virus]